MEESAMKFSLFSDFHHAPGRFPNATEKELDVILDRAEKENVDFIIHAGDLTHAPTSCVEFIEKYNSFHIPSYSCLGNHDTDGSSLADTLKLYNMPYQYYYFDCKGYRMIVFDCNYCKTDDGYVHYDLGNYYKMPAARDWIPPEEVEWLRKTIDESPYPCVLIGHGSFERPDGIKNREECLEIFRAANKKRPHSVLMIINGHHHRDNIRILDDICHFEINSTSFDWLKCTHELYPKELCDKVKNFSHCLIWNDPVHAIVTLEGTTITIDGMESEFFMGVTAEMTGSPVFDNAGRPAVPRVSSAKFTLH